MQLTSNRLCRRFHCFGVDHYLKVDLGDNPRTYVMDAEVQAEGSTRGTYHIDIKQGKLYVFCNDVLIKTVASGRMSEALDAIIRHYSLAK